MRNVSGYWYLDTDEDGIIDALFHFGKQGDFPVVGRWDRWIR